MFAPVLIQSPVVAVRHNRKQQLVCIIHTLELIYHEES